MHHFTYHTSIALLLTLVTLCHTGSITSTCSEVQASYSKMGYNILDVPNTPRENSEAPLEICSPGFSCCTRDMERQLAEHSRLNLDRAVNASTQQARNKLIAFTWQTYELIETIINNTESELLKASFGNSFSLEPKLFFDKIKDFMKGDPVKLGSVFDEAVEQLFLSIIQYKNIADHSNETCVRSWFNANKPFNTAINLRRTKYNFKNSLNAARAVLQGLAVGRNVMLQVSKMEPLATCSKAFTRATFCNHCAGLPAVPPCRNLCLNVMKGCLAYHADLQSSWGKYTDDLIELASKLETDWNLGIIFDDMKGDLISAVKQYLDNRDADAKLREHCGAASGTRRHTDLVFRSKRSVSIGYPLGTLMNRIRTNLRESKSVWLDLPYLVCANVTSQNNEQGQCWNGEAQGSYLPKVTGDGVTANVVNPEVKLDASRQDDVIFSSIILLTKISVELSKATQELLTSWTSLDIPIDADFLRDYPDIKDTPPQDRIFPQYVHQTQDLQIQNWVDEGSGSGWYSDDEDTEGSGSYSYDQRINVIPLPDSKQGGSQRRPPTRDDEEYSGSGDDEDGTKSRDYVNYNQGITSSIQSRIHIGESAKSTPKDDPQSIPYRSSTGGPRPTPKDEPIARTEDYKSAVHQALPSITALFFTLALSFL